MTNPNKLQLGLMVVIVMFSGSLAVASSLPLYSLTPEQLDNNINFDALYHNTREEQYRNPGWATQMTGAVPVGTDVTMGFRTALNDVSSVELKMWNDLLKEDNFYQMVKVDSDSEYDYWEYTITSPQQPTNFYYAFRIQDGTATAWYNDDTINSVFEDTRTYRTGGEGVAQTGHNGNGDFTLLFHDPNFDTPDWHRQGVGYQIFIDRFFNGDTSNDPIKGDVIWNSWDQNGDGDFDFATTDDEINETSIMAEIQNWEDEPGIWSYYGGDFQGVLDKIDHLKSMGVDFIWFNPFTESTDNHGYSVVDYKVPDSYYTTLNNRHNYSLPEGGFGYRPINDNTATLEFFKLFADTLEDNGIKIIYDTVINHASAEGNYFQRFEGDSVNNFLRADGFNIPDFYPGSTGWYENYDLSPYSDFFQKADGVQNHDYNSWFGFDSIPTIIFNDGNGDTGALNEFVTGPNNIFDYWLDLGVDGFRLDVNDIYVDGQDSNLVNTAIRDIVKAKDPDALIVGEIWNEATQQLKGDQNDATQNMLFRFNVLDWMKGNYDDDLIIELLRNIQDMYPREAFESLWVNLGNHDRTRALTVLNGEMEALKVASTLQFSYPGVPVVWYGDEIGTEGQGDPGTRQSFKWDKIEEDTAEAASLDLLNHYQTLSKIKQNYEVMQSGDFYMLEDTGSGVITMFRELEGKANDQGLIIANRDAQAKRATIDLSGTSLADGAILADLLNNNVSIAVGGNSLTIDVPAHSHMVLMSGVTNDVDTDLSVDGRYSSNTTQTSDEVDGNIPFFLLFASGFVAITILKTVSRKDTI